MPFLSCSPRYNFVWNEVFSPPKKSVPVDKSASGFKALPDSRYSDLSFFSQQTGS